MLKIALPNKGSLSEDAVQLVRDAGYSCRRYARELIVCDRENDVEFVFLRPRDIAVYVSNGVLDLGMTGRDLAMDSEPDVVELLSLGFGKSDFYYAVPKESSLTPEAFSDLRIATSYPDLVLRDLKRRNIESEVIRLDGAVEISIRLGVADVIADVVQTGKTMKQAGLKTVGESILKSEAVLIARSHKITANNGAKLFLERLRGICEITPGIESPTIAPLSKKGWVAVKAMGRKRDINRIMDELTRINAKGIIVTDIRTCRI